MSSKEVEFARTIHGSGADLLRLINDILDLSKIESGTTSIDLQEVSVSQIQDEVERTFDQIAQDKNLDFIIRCDEELPKTLLTDPTRLQQILKNLLSNAFKFTTEGSVTLDIKLARDHGIEDIAGPAVAFSVTDTGIGIPQEKFNVIFEAFQQADMGTSRKFGGTGLGLAISREIAGLLGGEIRVQSEIGRGSTFTFYHPLERNVGATVVQRTVAVTGGVQERIVRPVSRANAEEHSHSEIDDDRERIETADRVLLIIEDDLVFARILLGLARDRGFKGIVALSAAQGLALARHFRPDAITLDIGLPDTDGWSLLRELKHDTRDGRHPGARDLRRRTVAARTRVRRRHPSQEARHRRGAHANLRLAARLRRCTIEESAARRGRHHPAQRDDPSHRERRSRRHCGAQCCRSDDRDRRSSATTASSSTSGSPTFRATS